MMNGEVY